MANIIVAQITIYTFYAGKANNGDKGIIQRKPIVNMPDRVQKVAVSQPAAYNPQQSKDNRCPKHYADFANILNFAVQQQYNTDDHPAAHHFGFNGR